MTCPHQLEVQARATHSHGNRLQLDRFLWVQRPVGMHVCTRAIVPIGTSCLLSIMRTMPPLTSIAVAKRDARATQSDVKGYRAGECYLGTITLYFILVFILPGRCVRGLIVTLTVESSSDVNVRALVNAGMDLADLTLYPLCCFDVRANAGRIVTLRIFDVTRHGHVKSSRRRCIGRVHVSRSRV